MTRVKFKNSAAFYDVDGTLIKLNIVHAFAFYAARQPSLVEALGTWGITAASVPLFWAADKLSRKWFNELFYRIVRGHERGPPGRRSSEELFEDVIKPNIYPRARDLIAESRRAGCRQVIISGALDFTLRPLVELPRRRRLHRQPARVRRRLRDRQAAEAVRRRRHQGRHHARPTPASTASTWPSRGRTRTATPTSPCWPWSAARPPSTPTCGCARSLVRTTGRSWTWTDPATRASCPRCCLSSIRAGGPAAGFIEVIMRAIRPRTRPRGREEIVTIDTDSAPAHHVLRREPPARGPAGRARASSIPSARWPGSPTRWPRSATRSITPRRWSRCTRCSSRA